MTYGSYFQINAKWSIKKSFKYSYRLLKTQKTKIVVKWSTLRSNIETGLLQGYIVGPLLLSI